MSRQKRFRLNLVASWMGFAAIVAVWLVITGFELVPRETFPGPAGVIDAVMRNLTLGRVLEHVGVSLVRVLLGFGIGGLAGIVLGIVSGWYPTFGTVVRAPIELLRPVPPLAWIPLAIIWLGIGLGSKVLVIGLAAFFPMFTNAYTGIATIDPNVIRAGQTLGLRGWRLLLKVVVPMSLPDIATGMRLAWSYSFGAMVAAEIIAAGTGLGYLVMHGRELGFIGIIMFGIILIGTVNLTTDYIIQELILKRKLRWHFVQTST